MTVWLLDASILQASEDPVDEHHDDCGRLLSGGDPLATLDLAFYEVPNVAVRSWRDQPAARRLRSRLSAVADDAGIVRADVHLLEHAAAIADEHDISVYDSACAAARTISDRLLSCDVRDIASRDLAVLPRVAVRHSAEAQAASPDVH